MTEPDTILIDALAAIIRKVDGNHSLGAAALAEAILSDFLVIDIQIAGAMREDWEDIQTAIERKDSVPVPTTLDEMRPQQQEDN